MIDKNLAIQTIGLSKIFGGFTALDKLNIEVEPNSVYGFLGPNGSGKTTAIRLLTGLSAPSKGHSYIFGYDSFARDMEARRMIGYLPDVPSFFSFMNGVQYLTYCGELFGIDHTSAQKKAHELIELTGLQEAALRKTSKYSRGMKQRLGMAAALVGNPKVVFLDEPVSALDPIGRADILNIIDDLRDNMAVFFSTHILSDVERICDKVGIIDHGKLIVSNSVKSLKEENTKQGFEIKLKEDPSAILSAIREYQWCTEASCSATDDNIFKLLVYVTDENQARQGLQQLVIQHSFSLLSFNSTQVSLEDIFLKLAGGKDHE
ncbi:MAG: ABC transporter ATP-binding protein [Dehalococcoidia bacterium]|nr:ABC transporter ATP-binding protein [Dehalococcoidia bacterium]